MNELFIRDLIEELKTLDAEALEKARRQASAEARFYWSCRLDDDDLTLSNYYIDMAVEELANIFKVPFYIIKDSCYTIYSREKLNKKQAQDLERYGYYIEEW